MKLSLLLMDEVVPENRAASPCLFGKHPICNHLIWSTLRTKTKMAVLPV